jgi:hypothetical protein
MHPIFCGGRARWRQAPSFYNVLHFPCRENPSIGGRRRLFSAQNARIY